MICVRFYGASCPRHQAGVRYKVVCIDIDPLRVTGGFCVRQVVFAGGFCKWQGDRVRCMRFWGAITRGV